jgi:hypothetical protein
LSFYDLSGQTFVCLTVNMRNYIHWWRKLDPPWNAFSKYLINFTWNDMFYGNCWQKFTVKFYKSRVDPFSKKSSPWKSWPCPKHFIFWIGENNSFSNDAYLQDHSSSIRFSLWCSNSWFIPINRALLGQILLTASRLDSLLRKYDCRKNHEKNLEVITKSNLVQSKMILATTYSLFTGHKLCIRLSTWAFQIGVKGLAHGVQL